MSISEQPKRVFIAELPRARSPIAKKIWFPIHPRNFDSYVTVRPPTRPPARLSAPQENQCEMWHFLASVGACNLILHIHVVVKTLYRWRPYRGLSCRTIEDTCFFFVFFLPYWQVSSFQLIATLIGFLYCNIFSLIGASPLASAKSI